MDFEERASDIDLGVTKLCEPCELAKPERAINRQPQPRPSNILDEVYADIIQITPIGYNSHA